MPISRIWINYALQILFNLRNAMKSILSWLKVKKNWHVLVLWFYSEMDVEGIERMLISSLFFSSFWLRKEVLWHSISFFHRLHCMQIYFFLPFILIRLLNDNFWQSWFICLTQIQKLTLKLLVFPFPEIVFSE